MHPDIATIIIYANGVASHSPGLPAVMSRGVYGMLAVIVAVALAAASELQFLPLTQYAVVRAAWAWAQTAAGSFVLSAVAIGLGYVAAVSGVSRDRRGEAWSVEWLGRWRGCRPWCPWSRTRLGWY